MAKSRCTKKKRKNTVFMSVYEKKYKIFWNIAIMCRIWLMSNYFAHDFASKWR